MIGGVSAGIADYFGIDPIIVRLTLIFLFIATGFLPIVFFYLITMFMVPLSSDS